jgi:hypothetical protein
VRYRRVGASANDQSTDRPHDTHAVLAPALEGFAPTLEMPEIAEAMLLASRLA